MKKILYVMHVDWDWIKQRPQNIAENLAEFYDMIIIYPYGPKRGDMVKNPRNGLQTKPFFPIPFYITDGFIYKLHKIYLKYHLDYLIKKYNPDYIWITFPLLYNYIPCNLESKIIYDCMDDSLGFTDNATKKSRLLKMEKQLIEDSWKIFASSNNLASKLNKRKECLDKLTVIRNAFDGGILNESPQDFKKNDVYKIGFVGTVSSWFDFKSLEISLKQFDNIEYHIIGPLQVKPEIEEGLKDRFAFYGPVNHAKLYDYVKNFNCLVMPFKLNDLINSVDPVKLYEYLNFNKPIISIYYDELDQFEPYVYFYSNKEELVSLLDKMIVQGFKPKYSPEERSKFLKDNTWKNRVKKMIQVLND